MKRPGWVDYVRFNAVVDEALTVDELQRAPLITPLQHVPPNETNRNFMNYEERALAGRALEKLARKPHQNLEDIFKVSTLEIRLVQLKYIKGNDDTSSQWTGL